VVALDVRGHGESVQGWDRLGVDEAFAHLRWREMANDVVAVADDAGFDRAILGGHSMTNAVAMWACVSPKIRDRVAGVLVVKAASGWGERRDAMCVLREVLRTHAAFAAVLLGADERHAERAAETAGDETEMSSARVALGWETPEERTRRREAERRSVSKDSMRSAAPPRRHALWSSKIDAMLHEDALGGERGGGSGPRDRREDGTEGGRHRARRAAVRVARQRVVGPRLAAHSGHVHRG
jgi:pimeloyl-ACP methyl ester carboxylesterase